MTFWQQVAARSKQTAALWFLAARARASGVVPESYAKVEDYCTTLLRLQQPRYAHPLQRPRHYIPGLGAKPWYDTAEFPWCAGLEKAYPVIKEEFAELSQDLFAPALTKQSGDWTLYYLYVSGRKVEENCEGCPETARVIDAIPRIAAEGLVYFSVLNPGTHIEAHCGEANSRLRCHLALSVPEGCRIRVAREERVWEEGRCLIFDDSFEHEVWVSTNGPRAVLIVDVWHPDLTPSEIWALRELARISPRARQFNRYVLQHARKQRRRAEKAARQHLEDSL